LKEARPCVLCIFLLRFAAGALLTDRATDPIDLVRLCASALVWVTAIFFAYLLNGVMDVREDRINGSGRPIARGALPRTFAAQICAAAVALSLAGGCLLGFRTALVVALVLVVGWLYSGPPAYLKRHTAGTAAGGGALGLLTYLAGLAASPRPAPTAGFVVFGVTMSMWMAIVGAPAKDLSDIPGDAAAGRRTLAVMWGEERVRWLVMCTALLTAGGFSAMAWTAVPALRGPGAALTAGALGVVITSGTRLTRGSRTSRRRPYRAFMVGQYAAHICLLAAMVR
jgi:4-hydroxybenzoate polyprenyltransferase